MLTNGLEQFLGSSVHMNVLLIIGIAIFGGTIGARLFQKIHVPMVVGCIVIGVTIGQLGFRILTADIIENLKPISYFALGIIGFMIGGELRADVFRKYGKQFFTIMLAEGFGAFLLVAPLTTMIIYGITHDFTHSLIIGLILGAISSATDPASTVQVLWEYRTAGPLTSAVFAVVALDDALALALYALSTSFAGLLSGGGDFSLGAAAGHFSYELLGSVSLGLASGFILNWLYDIVDDAEKILPLTLGSLLVVIGVAEAVRLDLILTAMMTGVAVSNLRPVRSHEAFEVIKRFSAPIYVLFFVFVGARLNIEHMSFMIGALVVAYLLGRSFGKMTGAYIGARLSHAPAVVQRLTGMTLFTQAGVAVGLSIMATQRFGDVVGDVVIVVVAATTFVVQLIGPAFVKLAVKRAGEIDRNVTEEDLIKRYTVRDVMDELRPVLPSHMPLTEVLYNFSRYEYHVYCVSDENHRLAGIISIETMKDVYAVRDQFDFILAYDAMQSVRDVLTPGESLVRAMGLVKQTGCNYFPVVESRETMKVCGMLERRQVEHKLSQEIFTRKHGHGE